MVDERLIAARLPINGLMDVVEARRRGLDMALAMGFPLPEATKVAVVISELGRNIILYAGQGTMTLIPHMGEDKHFKIVAHDQGPGIEDVERVLEGGYSTSKGLGLGLSGSKRLVDDFDVQSVIGAGTMITAIKRLR
jgi:serine/threonine-protein kinase RsbT